MSKRLLDKIIYQPANPYWLSFFRIAFAFIGLVYAIRSLEFHSLRWFDQPQGFQSFALVVHWVWIFSLFLILIGLGGTLGWSIIILHYCLASIVLCHALTLGYSAQETIFMYPAFWLMFMPKTDQVMSWYRLRNPDAPVKLMSSWPIFLFGIHTGWLMFSAGICKWQDPLWAEGTGFYYFLLLPWVKNPNLNFLLDIQWFVYLVNHATLILEIGFIILFIFESSRWLSIIGVFCFFAGLIYPFRMDFIGLIGVTYSLAFLSITKLPEKISMQIDFLKLKSEYKFSPSLIKFKKITCALLIILISYLFLKPLVFHSYKEIEDYLKNSKIFSPIITNKKIETINQLFFQGLRWTLFTKEHTNGIFLYRVQIKMRDGSIEEPFIVFKDDKTPGPYTSSLVPRFAQALIYRISDICHYLSSDTNYTPNASDLIAPRALMTFAYNKLSLEQKANVDSIMLLVSPITVPTSYQGNINLWKDEPWNILFSQDHRKGIKWSGFRPKTFIRQGRKQKFKNYF